MRQGDLFWKLEDSSDSAVLDGLSALVGSSRRVLAAVLAHLGEVEERRLHLAAGYGSMFAYCVSRLSMSEDEAYRRIEVARLARRFPALFPLLAEGRLSLSVAGLLKPHLSADNVEELAQLLSGSSVQRARELLAARFPRPDAAATIRKLPEPRSRCEGPEHTPTTLPGLVESAPGAKPPEPVPEASSPSIRSIDTDSTRDGRAAPSRATSSRRAIEPLAEGRYRIQFTADLDLKNKLELARDLMRHSLPSGDLSSIVGRALELLVERLMKHRFGAARKRTSSSSSKRRAAPTAAKQPGDPAPTSTDPSPNVSRATRRDVLERDGLRCSYRSDDGVQCTARAWLEDDHVQPRGRGGHGGAANIRFLCRAHNLYAAEHVYGRAQIEKAIRRRRAKRTSSAPSSAAKETGPPAAMPANA